MVSVSVPCSCGEFIQGRYGSDEALISCPIDIYSTAIVEFGKRNHNLLEKVNRASKATLIYHGIDLSELSKLKIEINTPLPYGKGYATSTSEMVAVIVALSIFYGKSISPLEVARLCVEIEASDSVMFEGIALFKHLKCEFIESVKLKSRYIIVILELAETINTESLRSNGAFDLSIEDSKENFDVFLTALSNDDLDLLKKSMLLSALSNQVVLEKKYLKEISDMSCLYDAVAINIAHSGSLIGVLFKEEKKAKEFENEFKNTIYSELYSKTRIANVVNGGWIINNVAGGCNGFNN